MIVDFVQGAISLIEVKNLTNIYHTTHKEIVALENVRLNL